MPRFSAIWIATALLFAVSPLLASGSVSRSRAHRLRVRVGATHVAAYVLCSLFTAAGGLTLASQVAVGDPRVGVNFTLYSRAGRARAVGIEAVA